MTSSFGSVLRAFLLLQFFTICSIGPTFATDYYVDGKNGNDLNSGSQDRAFASVHRALDVVQPGDTIHVEPTVTYSGPFWIAVSGKPNAPITLQGDGGSQAMTTVVGSNSFAIQVDGSASYITIQGFDASAPGNRSAIFVSPGATHVLINGNRAHDSGGTGIAASGADYVAVFNNVVFNNAFDTTSSCGSGISLYQLRNTDGSTAVKNYVLNNVAYGNSNTPGGPCSDSDGNGIIIDDARNSQNNSPYGPYVGATLVANNVAFGNGGRGIHVYNSDNVTVVNNTLYENNQDPHGGPWQPGEITLLQSCNDNILNNIVYSDGLKKDYYYHVGISVQYCKGGGPVIVNNNLLYNAPNINAYAFYTDSNTSIVSIAPLGRWNTWADPRFKAPTDSGTGADFEVLRGSPAMNLGNPAFTPTSDILGNPAPRWPAVGAYEVPVN